jgi:hypothetical protein
LQDRLQDWLRKSKRLILEEAAKNKCFDIHECMLFYLCCGANTVVYLYSVIVLSRSGRSIVRYIVLRMVKMAAQMYW